MPQLGIEIASIMRMVVVKSLFNIKFALSNIINFVKMVKGVS